MSEPWSKMSGWPLAVAVFLASTDDSPADAETAELLELLKERQ